MEEGAVEEGEEVGRLRRSELGLKLRGFPQVLS
jgi:hypothetical protein